MVASKAFIKEQDLTDHILDISLIEGVVEDVLISKNSYTDKEYFEKSFNIKQDALVNIKEIEQKVLDFNASNDAKARVALQPGKSLGKTLVETVIEEPKRFSFDAFTDNAGQDQTGIYRAGAFSSVKGVLPLKMLRDSFSIGGVTSEGANSLFTSYSITEPFLKTTWNIGVDYSDTKIIEGELVPLDITGDSYNYHLSVRRPVYVSENIILGSELMGNIKDGSTYIGSYETQRVKTDTLTFSFDNLFLYDGGYFFSKIGMTKALKIDAGEGHFTHYNYEGEVEQYLIKGFSGNLKLKAQYADDDLLPSSDQIQIGGVGSVRGYKEGLLTGYRGLSLMSELKYDLKQHINYEYITSAETFVFYDFGRALFKDTGDISGKPSGTIESAGFGLRSQLIKRIDTSFTVAFPLTSHKYNDYKKDGEFLFNVQLKLW